MQNSLRSQLKVLGLEASKDPLTIESVNRQYQKLAKELHPDRYTGLTENMLRQLEARFSEVTAARNFFNDWWDCECQNFGGKQLAELADADYDWASEFRKRLSTNSRIGQKRLLF